MQRSYYKTSQESVREMDEESEWQTSIGILVMSFYSIGIGKASQQIRILVVKL